MHTILGIETSCDETAAAIIRRHRDGRAEILADIIHTQLEIHQDYGGVVPELAARAHVNMLDRVITQALKAADMQKGALDHHLDGIAVTAGPGLIGGVMVGMMTAKALGLSHDLPVIPVNHLLGHALSPMLTTALGFPYLLLLVSGGHTQILHVKGPTDFTRIGTTIDDAAGEAFDKTAKLLGLGQPGGPLIEAAARRGDPHRYDFPLPLKTRAGYDFSFSGLKTSVRQTVLKEKVLDTSTINNIAASFQHIACAHLVDRTRRAMTAHIAPPHIAAPMTAEMAAAPDDGTSPATRGPRHLVIAGGVAANSLIRSQFAALCAALEWELVLPPLRYCTDNGAMIAYAGAALLAHRGPPDQERVMAMAPRPRWPLDEAPAGKRYGGGKKGPKS